MLIVTDIFVGLRRLGELDMPNESRALASAAATVHCWSEIVPNRTFASLDKAIAYCEENISELHAIEVFVHSGRIPEPISDSELKALLSRKMRSLS